MAVKNLRNRIVAFVVGVIVTLGVGIAWGGLETGTYISDLVATNPLSSDLASTADDHLRLIKSTVKTTFPNINGAVTSTDEQLNPGGLGANPTGTIGLTAVNGTANTYIRSDGAPALSQAITPTMTGTWTFTKSGGGSAGAIYASAAFPFVTWNQSSGVAANNARWQMGASAEQFLFQTLDDADGSAASIMTVDRTGTTVDKVRFPTQAGNTPFRVGNDRSVASTLATFENDSASSSAAAFTSDTATVTTIYVSNTATSGDNLFINFYTEGAGSPADTLRGSIDYNRGGGVTRYNTTSDARLKKNFRAAPSARGLIDCIKIESYDWKENGHHVDHGLVAQRLDKCAPYAVSKGKIWQVDKSTLIPAMIKYVQEQDKRISQHERRIAELEAHQTALLIKEVEELRNRMSKMEQESPFVAFPYTPAANRGSIQYERSAGSVRYSVASDRRPK